MSLHRRAAKRDASEPEVVDALLRLGWSVRKWSAGGAPDLVVGRRGITHLIECKSGTKKPKPHQVEWHRQWKGSPVVVLRNAEEAIRFSQMHDTAD